MTVVDATPDAGLLLGYGSVGRLHARALAKIAPRLIIVDADARSRERAAQDHASATIAADLCGAARALPSPGDVLAVIATWGPSHAPLFHALVDGGIRRILCEKPLGTSVSAAVAMVQRAADTGTALTSHHYFRGSGLIRAIERLADDLGLGGPIAIVANGGAACLATNGLHWVDLGAVLFGCGPDAVVSTSHDDRMNPRSPELGFYGGSATWTFGGGRELTLVFSNASSVYPMTHIHYRDAVVTLDYDYDVAVYRRNAADVARFPAVTRTGSAQKVAFRGQLPGVLDGLAALTSGLARLCTGDVSTSPPEAAVVAVSGTIGALASGRDGRRIALPIAAESAYGREEWPIS